ncbi:hypothetical protein D3C77_718910 [compost metagenome]
MRDFQARFVDQSITEQQNIQVQRARAPALQALAALIILDGLQRVEQFNRRKIAVESSDRVGVPRLAWQQRVALIEGGNARECGLRQLPKRFDGAA